MAFFFFFFKDSTISAFLLKRLPQNKNLKNVQAQILTAFPQRSFHLSIFPTFSEEKNKGKVSTKRGVTLASLNPFMHMLPAQLAGYVRAHTLVYAVSVLCTTLHTA